MGIEETGTDTHLAQARRMLDIFASVGAERFHVTWTNSGGDPRRPRSLRAALQSLSGPLPYTDNEDWLDAIHIAGISAADLGRTLPALLDTANADRLNLTIRPRGSGVRFIQLDDLTTDDHQIATTSSGGLGFGTWQMIDLASVSFIIIQTSPGKYQAWLAMPGEHDREFARRVKRAVGADLNASGATKIAGSLNFKDKYVPNFPRVTIRYSQPGCLTSPDELERMGLVAPLETFAPLSPARPLSRGTDKWPSYSKCLDGAPRNRGGSGPDRSRADYWFCFLAIQWGHGENDAAERLMQESTKAREKGKSYAAQTAHQAATAVERRRQQ
ncbi:MAG: hypothetical protein JOZ36_15260 [Acidobacteria bacterium]|nr:hypothetical protein [Acidobacteriota bacterium]